MGWLEAPLFNVFDFQAGGMHVTRRVHMHCALIFFLFRVPSMKKCQESLSLRTIFLWVVAWVKVLRYILGHMWFRVLGSPCDPFKCGQSQNVVQRRACGCWNRLLCRARAPGHRTSPDTISVRGAGMAIVEGSPRHCVPAVVRSVQLDACLAELA